jgi:predicted signal transduction protein with EAL and GGDEF domain
MLIASFEDLIVEPTLCLRATGPEQNCTVLPVVWAMRTVALIQYFSVYRAAKAAVCWAITRYSCGRKSMHKRRSAILAAGLLLAMTAALFAQTNKEASAMPKVGDMAPDFTLNYIDASGEKQVKLSDYRGKKNVVLAFYIFAFTGG